MKLTVFSFLFLLSLNGCALVPINPVSKNRAIAEMIVYDPNQEISKPISKENYSKVLSAFNKSKRIVFGVKWQVFGMIAIKYDDGSSLYIYLYTTGENIGAYSIDRAYYRGGSDSIFEKIHNNFE